MPLSGIRVLDFGRYIAGPHVGALLADYGADVIRIEAPGGNDDRFIGPVAEDGSGAMFLQLNRSKRSLSLKPGKPEGRAVVERLVRTADVVIANLPQEALDKLELDHDSLSRINPGIILVTASAFGSQGPLANRVGLDSIGQAMSGAVYLTGTEDQPYRSQAMFVDYATAAHCAFGVMLALRERERTGLGQCVSSSLLGTALAITNGLHIDHALTGIERKPIGNRSYSSAPTDMFRTRDGWIVAQIVGEQIFGRWAALVGRPDLVGDPRFASDITRGNNGAALSAIMADWCAERTSAEVLAQMGEARLPAAPVLKPGEVLQQEQVKAVGLVEPTTYPGTRAAAPVIRAPINLSRSGKAAHARAPTIGEHSDEILAELGFSHDEIASLRTLGVI